MDSALTFKASRTDGRSDTRVICDLIKSAAPGDVFTFDQISEALSTGTEREFPKHVVCNVVSRAYAPVLRDTQRALHSVRGVGYRVALASEQEGLARHRKQKSDRQLRRAILTLEQVRFDEMDEQSRAAHMATLVLVSDLMQRQTALEQRQNRVEDMIQKLMGREKE